MSSSVDGPVDSSGESDSMCHSVRTMWNIPRVLLVASAAFLLLAGCVQRDAIVTPAPVPSATPMFASEQEALAAAEKAYAAFVKASDQVTADGGLRPDRIASLVTKKEFDRDLKVFAYYRENGIFTRGETKFDSVELQSYSGSNARDVEVTLYVCSDLSSIQLVNSSGVDVTPPNLVARSPMEITLSLGTSRDLVIERSQSWPGKDFCSRA